MHSSCYDSVQECIDIDSKTYFTAELMRTHAGSVGGDWSTNLTVIGSSKYAQASCLGMVGKSVCWSRVAPIHVSDGGGPQDKIKELMVEE